MGEQSLGGLGDDWAHLGRIEIRTSDEQNLHDAITDGRIGQEFAQDRHAGGLVERLSDGEEFIRPRRTVQLADEFGDERSADLGVERERGEHASFGGERLCFLRSQERGDGLGLTLEVHAHEEALEIALVSDANLDRLAATTGSDRTIERRPSETHHHAEGGGMLHRRFAEGLDGGGADFGIRVGRERGQRLEMGRPCPKVTQRVHRFAADIAIRISEEALGERTDLLTVLGQDPEGLDAAGGGSRGITGDRG